MVKYVLKRPKEGGIYEKEKKKKDNRFLRSEIQATLSTWTGWTKKIKEAQKAPTPDLVVRRTS